MKKLTAGVFATILGVTAMGAADAAVTSKGYVDAAVATAQQTATEAAIADAEKYIDATELETSQNTQNAAIAEAYVDKTSYATDKTNLEQSIANVKTTADAAAPQDTTYTKDQVDAAIAAVDGTTEISGLQGQIDAIKQEQTTQNTDIINLQNDKANAADVYTKTEADAAFATAAQGAKADTAVQTAAINDMATKTWVGEQNYVDETELAGKGYLTSTSLTDYATKTEAQGYADAKDTAISAAQTAAKAANAALNTASKLSDGQYALTMKVVDGVTTYGWELIDREYAAEDLTANGQ